MKTSMLRFILFTLISLQLSNSALAENNRNLYVFGDSLSDTGNVYIQTSASGLPIPVPPQKRYFNGRFSNGPNAAEQFWKSLGNSSKVKPILALSPEKLTLKPNKNLAISFAYGGSETSFGNSVLGQFNVTGLLGQVGMFKVIKNDSFVENSLAFVWSGANDYLNQFGKGIVIPTEQVVDNISKSIRNLYASGIRRFLVPNLPDLSEVPIANFIAYQDPANPHPEILDLLSFQTIDHNNRLRIELRELAKLPKIKIYKVDIYSITKSLIVRDDQVVAGPAAGCLYSPVLTQDNCSIVPFDAGNGLIFWDEIHPTTEVHKVFAEAMLDSIKN
ncbi:SGNH/GDSL hydrolase family protein [Methylomonas sp. BW4-1]|uniref:SGNH/GDSL hydrolase family protein n=1 Tax=unclassified Methylomonas TaxID=2608980 RepID=UPI001967F99E|nr:SGNH/GDSL hydrolase family protein [Methylomonas sp. EFPC1]QSB00368.1 SGNH/GDSL hydrolase family protein [Methylomonas sp. EFPC1]